MKRHPRPTMIRTALISLLGLGALLTLSACTMSPYTNLGLDVNYYNGGFHVNPNAHIGISGRPR